MWTDHTHKRTWPEGPAGESTQGLQEPPTKLAAGEAAGQYAGAGPLLSADSGGKHRPDVPMLPGGREEGFLDIRSMW